MKAILRNFSVWRIRQIQNKTQYVIFSKAIGDVPDVPGFTKKISGMAIDLYFYFK